MDRQAFEQALERANAEPESFDANHRAALLAIDMGEPMRAVSFLIRAYTLEPSRADVLDTLRKLCGPEEFERIRRRLPAGPRVFWKDALLCLAFPFHPKIFIMVLISGATLFFSQILLFAMVLSPSLILALAFCGMILATVGFFSFVQYRIIESTALYRGFTVSLVAESWAEAFDFGLRMILAFVLCFSPSLIAGLFEPPPLVLYLLAVPGLIYFPMQLLCIFLSERIQTAIDPRNVWRLLRLSPGHYSVVVLFFVMTIASGFAFDALVQPTPDDAMMWMAPKTGVMTLFLFMMARCLGVLYVHHKKQYAVEEPEGPDTMEYVDEPPEAFAAVPVRTPQPRAADIPPELKAKFDEARRQALADREDVEAQILAGTLGLEAAEKPEAVNFFSRAYRLEPRKFVYEKLRAVCDEKEFRELRLIPPPGNYAEDLWTSFAYPIRGAVRVFVPGVIFFVLAGIAMNLVFELLVPVFWGVLAGYSILMLFNVTRAAATGDEDDLTWDEFIDVIHCGTGLVKLAFVIAVSFSPAILLLYVIGSDWETLAGLKLAGMTFLILLGSLYLPMAVLAAVFTGTLWAAVRPRFILRSILAIRRDYFRYCALAGLCLMGSWALLGLGFLLESAGGEHKLWMMTLAVIASAIGNAAWLYFSIVSFRALGLLYRDNRHLLLWDK